MTRFAIGLGSNMGDRLEHLVTACSELRNRLGQLQVSPVYETKPVGGPDQDPFLNAVATVESDLGPFEVLEVCQVVEKMHDRRRDVRWGPRTLDLDVITSDGPRVSDDRLIVPHPRAAEREFVLRPLADLWPDAPVAPHRSAMSALQSIPRQGVDRLATDWIPPVPRWKAHVLVVVQFFLILGFGVALVLDGRVPGQDWLLPATAGAFFALLGVGMVAVAARQLGTSISAMPIPKREAPLVTSGLYRLARHPIYGGVSLFLLGTALVFASVVGLVVAAFLPLFFLLKASYEEKQLRLHYAGYLAYKERVTKWLIPFVV